MKLVKIADNWLNPNHIKLMTPDPDGTGSFIYLQEIPVLHVKDATTEQIMEHIQAGTLEGVVWTSHCSVGTGIRAVEGHPWLMKRAFGDPWGLRKNSANSEL